MILLSLLAATTAQPSLNEMDSIRLMYKLSETWTECVRLNSQAMLEANKSAQIAYDTGITRCLAEELALRQSITQTAKIMAQSKDPETQRELAKEPLDASTVMGKKKRHVRDIIDRFWKEFQQERGAS